MLVLVATRQAQGAVSTDYSWTVEGELVTPVASQCTNRQCGCDRGLPGLASHRATTTAQIVDLPHITDDDLWWAVHGYLEAGGWIDLLMDDVDERDLRSVLHVADAIESLVDEHVEAIQRVCRTYPVGTIVERLDSSVFARSLPMAA